MKTKIFLFLCLLLGMGLTQIYGQIVYPDPYAHNKHGTGATITKDGLDLMANLWLPVFCDGEFVEFIVVDCTVQWVDHWKDGNWISLVVSIHGEAKSSTTDEVFKFNEQFKNFDMTTPPWMFTWNVNLTGNKGSHFIMSLSYDLTNDVFTLDKTMCF